MATETILDVGSNLRINLTNIKMEREKNTEKQTIIRNYFECFVTVANGVSKVWNVIFIISCF